MRYLFFELFADDINCRFFLRKYFCQFVKFLLYSFISFCYNLIGDMKWITNILQEMKQIR